MEDAGGVEGLLEEARGVIDRLDPEQAAEAQRSGAIIVDTRCSEDRRAEGVIPGSVHAARTVLEWRADPRSPDRDPVISDAGRLIIVCNDGYSSSLAAANLVRLGHRAVADVIGGFRAWRAMGLPIVADPSTDEGE